MKPASEIQLTGWLWNAAGVPITSSPDPVLETLLLSGEFFSWRLSSPIARVNKCKFYHSEANRLPKKSSATSQKSHSIPYLSIRIQALQNANNLNSDVLLEKNPQNHHFLCPSTCSQNTRNKTEVHLLLKPQCLWSCQRKFRFPLTAFSSIKLQQKHVIQHTSLQKIRFDFSPTGNSLDKGFWD